MKKTKFHLSTYFFLISALLMISLSGDDFREDQKKYSRVRQAYAEKEIKMKNLCLAKGIKLDKLEVYYRVFKHEKLFEVWARNRGDLRFKKLVDFDICATCGDYGPKRQQGDRQIPEGYYHIDRFNPTSMFHLSLGINYPNKSDRILGVRSRLGGDIFIHGNCMTDGCVPLTDTKIKELYLLSVEAKNAGQNNIPITFFPMKMEGKLYESLRKKFEGDSDKLNLWTDLEKGYKHFETWKKLPSISFLPSGRHRVY